MVSFPACFISFCRMYPQDCGSEGWEGAGVQQWNNEPACHLSPGRPSLGIASIKQQDSQAEASEWKLSNWVFQTHSAENQRPANSYLE